MNMQIGGKILGETIAFFGDSCDYNKSYYHGLNKTFVFPAQMTFIYGPLSTSLYYNVVKNFSHNIGMIIEFNINTTPHDYQMDYPLNFLANINMKRKYYFMIINGQL